MNATSGAKPFCPECGKAATGKFCQHCGAKLGGRSCNQCGAKLAPNARFCNQCGDKSTGGAGHRAAAASAVGGLNLPWWIAGVAMFGLIVVVGSQMVAPEGPAAPTQVQPQVQPTAGAPTDISQMTPIEAADRLYNRVMRAVSDGDSAQAQQFMPMAVGAYERARPLNLDGLFHLSLLQRTAGSIEAALATAEAILAEDPDHLLGLHAAGEAASALGRDDEARGHYQHIVDVYDVQMARQLLEYLDHSAITDDLLRVAEAFLAAI